MVFSICGKSNLKVKLEARNQVVDKTHKPFMNMA